MKVTVTNVEVGSLGEYSDRAAARGTCDGLRYHIWFNVKTGFREPTLYQNPPLDVDRDSPDHFRTRHLTVTSKRSAAIIEAIFAAVEAEGLVAKAVAAFEAGLAEEERARQAEIKKRREEAAGPALAAAARPILAKLITNGRATAGEIADLAAALKLADGEKPLVGG